ncbi:TetR/AcrR family transcriptional regulator [Alkaliphilus peptidifermentans]|nr:TetR/AcrR family transcriptional regulator [Alkaliphilus peptidifermentans]
MSTRAEQKEKRRLEILKVSLDLFIRKGYAATKITDIAQEANMSVGLLFHYFPSKDKLYEELIRIGMSGPKMVMAEDQSDPLTFFESTAKNILHYAVSDPFVAKMFVLIRQAEYNDAIPENIKELLQLDDTYTQSALLMEKGQQNKTIRQGNTTALTIAFWAAIQGVCEALALDPTTPCPESDWIVDIIRRK